MILRERAVRERERGLTMEFTFDFTWWFAILLMTLIIICGAVTAIVFRRITTRYEKKIEQARQGGG
jgi:hypothetical protein